MTEDAKLAHLLLTVYENRRDEIVTNVRSNIVFNWHTLPLADKEAWLAVVKVAREKLIDVQGPIE